MTIERTILYCKQVLATTNFFILFVHMFKTEIRAVQPVRYYLRRKVLSKTCWDTSAVHSGSQRASEIKKPDGWLAYSNVALFDPFELLTFVKKHIGFRTVDRIFGFNNNTVMISKGKCTETTVLVRRTALVRSTVCMTSWDHTKA